MQDSYIIQHLIDNRNDNFSDIDIHKRSKQHTMRTNTQCWRIAEMEKDEIYGRSIDLYIYVDTYEDGRKTCTYRIVHNYYNYIRGWYSKHFETQDLEALYEEWGRLKKKYKFKSVFLWNWEHAIEYGIKEEKM